MSDDYDNDWAGLGYNDAPSLRGLFRQDETAYVGRSKPVTRVRQVSAELAKNAERARKGR